MPKKKKESPKLSIKPRGVMPNKLGEIVKDMEKELNIKMPPSIQRLVDSPSYKDYEEKRNKAIAERLKLDKKRPQLVFTDVYKPGMTDKEFRTKLMKLNYPEPYGSMVRWELSRGTVFFSLLPDVMTQAYAMKELRKTFGQRVEPVFNFWLKEYVDGLAKYLKEKWGNGVILEVGAGNGALSKLLKDRGLNMRAVDNRDWKGVKFPRWVEKMDYAEGVIKHQPVCVISSWMPLYEDWTPVFRKMKTVKEYILIGEGQGGCVGSEPAFTEFPGWIEKNDFDFDKYNFCRTDTLDLVGDKESFGTMLHSSTISFTRTKTTVPERIKFWIVSRAGEIKEWLHERKWKTKGKLRIWKVKFYAKYLKKDIATDWEKKFDLDETMSGTGKRIRRDYDKDRKQGLKASKRSLFLLKLKAKFGKKRLRKAK